ncbi:MAG: PSD1 and planctomycete cytochrome C domain-containing protein [Verrucomicrobiota bacterium]
MKPSISLPTLAGAFVLLSLPARFVCASSGTPLPAAEVEFFEKSVRPILEEHCLECHSAAKGKTKGGLALDSSAALHKGGSSGAVVTPGNPDKSILITAVRYKDPDTQMPPEDKKLPPEKIAILEEWVRRGAIDPREGKALGPDPEVIRKHWAYQALKKPELPKVQNSNWAKTSIDLFILSSLEAKNIPPSPEADRKTLLRRLSYDLIGLPPAQSEIDAFLTDQSPDAYEQVVNRLLASPHFGERWGRHWLDVARYSDTKGLPAPINADRRFHFAFSYRDYVIASYNEDKPFDRFLMEQLAADQLPDSGDPRSLAALGFLTVGRCFQNQIHEIIDDRIDVVTRGLMGISVGCARCHDHKFDPILTKDYYSLHGIFMSSEEPKERPILGQPLDTPAYREYLQKRAELLQKIEDGLNDEIQKDLTEIAKKSGAYLLATLEKGSEEEVKKLQTFAGQRKLVAISLNRWVTLLKDAQQDPVLGPWKILSALPDEDFKTKAKEDIDLWATESLPPWNPLVLKALRETPPISKKHLSEIYSNLFAEATVSWLEMKKPGAEKSAPLALPDPALEQIRLIVHREGGPANLNRKDAESVFGRALFETRTKLQDKVDALDAEHPAAPPRAMAIFDKAKPVEPVVFVRGNPGNRGPAVPRQFISFLAPKDQKPFIKGSGRLELAEAITAPTNPLTSRVAVNRIWLHLFGKGLVETPNDFGVQTPAPILSTLLDHLACRFIEGGWSTKNLIRQIVLSNTYKQSSAPRPDAATADPANDLLHSQRRRRLDYEALQDTLLMISGGLDKTMGGRPVELTKAPYPGRRSVYGYIDRQDLPSVLRNFDFANPDITTGQRFETTVPQQALFLMNNDLLFTRAKALTQLAEIQYAEAGPARIHALFQRVHQRPPSSTELEACKALVAAFQNDPQKPWLALAQALLITNETAFID